MEVLKWIIKSVWILLTVVLMVSPLLAEMGTFKRDKDRRISYKRLRVVLFTALYLIAVMVALFVLRDLTGWLADQSFIRWIISKLALRARTVYYAKVLVVMLINFAIGLAFCLLSKFVRIGLKKKNILKPDENGEFRWSQRVERRILRFFCTETWFFVGSVLKFLSISLTMLYALLFALYQVPALFGAEKMPFRFISALFEASPLYPMAILLMLWQCYFFLSGLEQAGEEEKQALQEEPGALTVLEADMEKIDKAIREQFGCFHACDVDLSKVTRDDAVCDGHDVISNYIGTAVETDARTAQTCKEIYLDCMDKLVKTDKSFLISGSFFSDFSAYFLRYLSAVIARGDNVVFVCNSEEQIRNTHAYIQEGLSKIASLYYANDSELVNFDDPIWRVVMISGETHQKEEALVEDSQILVTSLDYLCSDRFANEKNDFIERIDTVVFVDTLNTINHFARQMKVLNTRLKQITQENVLRTGNRAAVGREHLLRMRYLSRKIRYICFDDTRVAGLDKVLKNLLASEFDAADAMRYNPQTIVRCYNYEARRRDDGSFDKVETLDAAEELGVLMNVALTCLSLDASNVTIFLDDLIPFQKLQEIIASNSGALPTTVDTDRICFNKECYDARSYSVIIAMDSGDNLPTALRKYIARATEQPTLILLFSRPYMLREYYVSQADNMLTLEQTERIPYAQSGLWDAAHTILSKANYGGITTGEILQIAAMVAQLQEYAHRQDVNAILQTVLEACGEPQRNRLDLFKYFTFTLSHVFGPNGEVREENRVMLRRSGRLLENIQGRPMVTMRTGEQEFPLKVPRSRLRQNFIAGQNLVHNGEIYHIKSVDVEAGRLHAALAVSDGRKQPYRYVQDRQYRIELGQEEQVYPAWNARLENQSQDICLDEVRISAFRAPTEVIVHGYYQVDPYTLSAATEYGDYINISKPGDDARAKQCYRRYGQVENPYYSSESLLKSGDSLSSTKGALILSIQISGQFGADANKTMALASVMLNELMHSMFPSVADSVVICPVLSKDFVQAHGKILKKQPKLELCGNSDLLSNSGFTLLLIEDCQEDLGVISSLMSSGSDVLQTLFCPLLNYLRWYSENPDKDAYLYFGENEPPACFDFDALHTMATLLADDGGRRRSVNLESLVEWEICDFCGKRYPKSEVMTKAEDGRKMCKRCNESLVGNNKKALKSHLEQAKRFLENTYGIELDDEYDFCFASTVKIVEELKRNQKWIGRGADLPLRSYVDANKRVHVEYGLPSANLSELLVRELTCAWQKKHLPQLNEELAEGHIALVGIQYLRFLNEQALATARTHYYESNSGISGEGYRKLVRQLLLHPQHKNNPFRYLLELYGMAEQIAPTPEPPVIEEELGPQYQPEQPDRITDGPVASFYHGRLVASEQAAYDRILTAVGQHEPLVNLDGCAECNMERILNAISFDHPELFYWLPWETNYETHDVLKLAYGVNAEQEQLLQRRIDEATAEYLAGIEEKMSAYDVALRLYVKLIGKVDYDGIALAEEEKRKGPTPGQIDNLRTICGVFLNQKAVCEGYARRCSICCRGAVSSVRRQPASPAKKAVSRKAAMHGVLSRSMEIITISTPLGMTIPTPYRR